MDILVILVVIMSVLVFKFYLQSCNKPVYQTISVPPKYETILEFSGIPPPEYED
jgi:hypothetical protein